MASELYLDVDFETARALHRVVRGMHDGECPKCHRLHSSTHVRGQDDGLLSDLVCPFCRFTITAAEQDLAIRAFAPVMERNLAVFEEWRARLSPDAFMEAVKEADRELAAKTDGRPLLSPTSE